MRRMWGHACMDMYSKVKDVALYTPNPYFNFEFQITDQIKIGTRYDAENSRLYTCCMSTLFIYIT